MLVLFSTLAFSPDDVKDLILLSFSRMGVEPLPLANTLQRTPESLPPSAHMPKQTQSSASLQPRN